MKKKVNLSDLFWKKNQDYQTQVSLKQDGLANSLKAEDDLYDYYLNEDYKKGKGEEGKWWYCYTGSEPINLVEKSDYCLRFKTEEEAKEELENEVNQEVDLLKLKWEIYNVEQPHNVRSLDEINKHLKEIESKDRHKKLPLYAHYKDYVFIIKTNLYYNN